MYTEVLSVYILMIVPGFLVFSAGVSNSPHTLTHMLRVSGTSKFVSSWSLGSNATLGLTIMRIRHVPLSTAAIGTELIKHTLLIHHFEETWREGLAGFGMTPEVMAHNIIDYLHSPEGRAINHVILTTWEMPGPCDVQKPVTDYLDARGIAYEHHIFGYGEVREMYEGQDCELIQATRYGDDPDQVVCIEDWHRELVKSASVSLCGAFDGECIQDAEDMLTHLRGSDAYTKLNDLVVGTGETYWPRLDCHDAQVNARRLIEEYEERFEDLTDPAQEGVIIRSFRKDLARLSKDPAFQLVALFPSEDVGYIHSENEKLDAAITTFVQGMDIKKRSRNVATENCPGL